MAWYVTDGDLVRAGGHKYIDKIRNAAGNWTYIYEDAKNKLTSGVNSIKSRINNYKTNKNANKVSNDEATKRIKENAAANRAESDKQLSTARMQASKQRAASITSGNEWRKKQKLKALSTSGKSTEHFSLSNGLRKLPNGKQHTNDQNDVRTRSSSTHQREAIETAERNKKIAAQKRATAAKSSRHNASDFAEDTKGRAEYRQTTAKQNKQRGDFDSSFDSRSAGTLKTAKRNANRIRNAAAANRAEQEAAVRQVGIAEAKKDKRQRNSEATQKLLKQAARNAEKVRNGALVSEAVAKNKKAASDARLASENKERLRASGESGTRNRIRARKAQEYNRNAEASRRAVEKNQRTARYNEGQRKKEEQKRYNASATRRERRLG